MPKPRLLVAAIAVVLTGAVTTLTATASTGAESNVAENCPPGTVPATLLGGDDFESASDADPEDKIHLDWNITEGGAFKIAQSTVNPSRHFLHGANPTTRGITSVETTSPFDLPSGKKSVLIFRTKPQLDRDTKPTIQVAVDGVWQRIGEVPNWTTGTTTHQFDLGPYEGQAVTLRFSIDATYTSFSGNGTGWNIDDVFFRSCDPETLPAAPSSIVVPAGFDGGATLNWGRNIDSDPTNDATAYQLTMRPGDEVRTVPANTLHSRFTGLDMDTKYKA